MLEDDDLIIVRGGRMGAEALRRALQTSAERGVYQLSTQYLPKDDDAAQTEIWDFWLERYKTTCWTTPRILAESGLTAIHTPSEDHGRFHVDVRHPANPGELEVDMVISDFQCAFFGPDQKRTVTHEWTSTDLRRLQQPLEEG